MNKMIIAGLTATIIGFSSCCGNSAKCENDSAAKCDTVYENSHQAPTASISPSSRFLLISSLTL